jgi:hypothetical protein
MIWKIFSNLKICFSNEIFYSKRVDENMIELKILFSKESRKQNKKDSNLPIINFRKNIKWKRRARVMFETDLHERMIITSLEHNILFF